MWLFVSANKLHLTPPNADSTPAETRLVFLRFAPERGQLYRLTAKENSKQKPRLTVVIPSPLKKGTRRSACEHCTEPLQHCKFLSKLQFIIFLHKTQYLP